MNDQDRMTQLETEIDALVADRREMEDELTKLIESDGPEQQISGLHTHIAVNIALYNKKRTELEALRLANPVTDEHPF